MHNLQPIRQAPPVRPISSLRQNQDVILEAMDKEPVVWNSREGIAPDCYLWMIFGHAILIRKGAEDNQPKLWSESIRPVETGYRT